MYENRKIISIIPARGGSKGIPKKNIIDLCGKPLIAYTIEASLESKYIDETIVSTDCEEIAKVAIEYGANVPFLRPKELALDTSKTIDVVMHLIKWLKQNNLEYMDLVLLQPTAPLRNAEDIDNAIIEYYKNGRNPLATVDEVDDNPILIRTINGSKLEKMISISSTCRRQDMPKYYKINGGIYINDIDEIDVNTSFNDNCVPYVMEKSHSIDIDEMKDLVLARYYLLNNNT